jgi:hypothetical protein
MDELARFVLTSPRLASKKDAAMDKSLVAILAERAGLEKALADFPDDVAAAARQAEEVARKVKPPADGQRAEPWPPMRPGEGL